MYDVAVIGVPDEEMGEQVEVVVTIARDKAPRTADFADRLPRSATGTVVKGELRRKYLEATGDNANR